MTVGYRVIYLFLNIFWLYTLRRYMRMFFDRLIVSKRVELLAYVGFYLLSSITNLMRYSPILNLIVSILGLFCVTLMYKSYLSKKIIATFITYAISMVCDVAAASMIGVYVVGKPIAVINIVVAYLLIFIVQILLESFVQLRREYQISKMQFLAMLGVPMCSIAIICALIMYKIEQASVITLITLVLLFINIIVFLLYDSIMKEYEERFKYITLNNQIQMYKNQLEVINKSQDKIQSLRHDIKHHLMALRNMVVNESPKEAESYLDDMMEALRNPKEYASSGNRDIDSMMNYLAQKAIDKSITVNIKLNIAERFQFNFFDLNVIMGNLMDNGIDAAEESEEKYIDVSIELDKSILYIDVSNSFDGIVLKEEGKIKSRKNNTRKHGYGLRNIEVVVDKYNGIMTVEHENKEFKVSILLYTNQEEKYAQYV